MHISVIIPYRDRNDALTNTLTSLVSQRTPRRYEILVVDDGSVVPPQNLVLHNLISENIRYISQRNGGISKARNAGLHASSADVVIFLDCDMVVRSDFVESHAKLFDFSASPLLQVGPRRQLSVTPKGLSTEEIFELPSVDDDRTDFFSVFSSSLAEIEIGWHLCFGHNMSMRRADAIALSGFDENFQGWGFEDCEFAYRFRKLGGELIYNPSIAGLHQYHEFKWPVEATRYKAWRQNLDYFSSKHRDFSVMCQYILDPYFNPNNNVLDNIWTELLIRMEKILRIAKDRRGNAEIAKV
ncbi:glycosyltransferase involved in cell wall biosynthesis [Rhizobium leguminosarum]|uniref:glycosyltransferase family 2 protein n=1 Tax=Rhizobium leguminosarum TaxID=384 RepID=UPI00160BCB0C|nr:glycosyltransferase [Rhizobium leguminosarum]MBB4419186.1 glycosyltransferase involved in cell wall biosynthesis [Rhizobium leguminosarum]